MPSERKLAANRANAKASTGPKSTAGKKASSRNARKLGLSIEIASDPSFAPQIEALARLIHPAYPEAPSAWVRQVAAAELDLIRIRNCRTQLSAAVVEPGAGRAEIAALAVKHTRLDRYEKRAYSRRTSAIKSLMSASVK
jgi:hypothetical protein